MEKIYNVLLISQFVLSALVFFALIFITAPYGKHSKNSWGMRINSKTGWLLMETPAVFTIILMFFYFRENINITLVIFLTFWQLHYVYRTFIYSSLMRGSQKTFPLLLVFFALFFNLMNGYIVSFNLFENAEIYNFSWLRSPQFIIGGIIFIYGFRLHIKSDSIIRNLRKPGETDYKITSEGMFRFVSNPNYLGEIVQWYGFALMTLSVAALAFAVFTTANLLPRAISNHKWYKDNFGDYPEERKILIPYIF